MEPNKSDNVAQALVSIAPYFILAIMGPLLVLHSLDSSSHDVVLSIVSGLVGAAVGPRAQAALSGVIKAPQTQASKDDSGGA